MMIWPSFATEFANAEQYLQHRQSLYNPVVCRFAEPILPEIISPLLMPIETLGVKKILPDSFGSSFTFFLTQGKHPWPCPNDNRRGIQPLLHHQ